MTNFLSRRQTIFWSVLSILWMAVIFLFSSQAHSGAITEAYLGSLNVPIRKCGHMFEFALLFLLYTKALGDSQAQVALKALVLTVLYALSDEFHQSFVAGRSSSLMDVGVDSIGAFLSLLLRHIFLCCRK